MTRILCISLVLIAFLSCTTEKKEQKKYEANWKSLSTYECPDWFTNAKFGIWAHSSPQDVPMEGDWYAHNMYKEGHKNYKYHVENYGHPSEVGYKDLLPKWTLEKWNPDKLMSLYKRAGARYFVALANHHCNFDTWNSKHQKWNSVNIGPKRDVVGEWKKAADKYGLKFGVSVHNINTWGWFLNAFKSDTKGPKKGVSYDGRLTLKDGKGKWWEGYDPAMLYSPYERENDSIPSREWMQNWYDRCVDLVDSYQPDLLYFDSYIVEQVWRQFTYHGDDTYEGVPEETKRIAERTPFKEAGIEIISYFYNQNRKWHGKENGVMNIKVHDLNESVPEVYKKGMVIDREKGGFGGGEQEIQKYPWQKDRPFGAWHYNKKADFPTTTSVIWNLVDVVSKNGNLLLGIPMKPDGTLHEKEYIFLEEMGEWMDVNSEGIYDSKIYEVYGHDNVRYTRKGKYIYAFCKVTDETSVELKNMNQAILSVYQLGLDMRVEPAIKDDVIHLPVVNKGADEKVICFKIETK